MKVQITLLALVLLGLFSCSENDSDVSDSFPDDASITTLNGTWKVVSFEDLTLGTTELKNKGNSWGLDIVVYFDDTLDPKLFGGQVTTNTVSAAFEYIGRRQFKLDGYGSTFAGQPEWADRFGNAVSDERVTYRINIEQLRIYYDNKTRSVTLTKE